MPHIEFPSGGLVTARDPSLLQPNELAVAEDVMLLPGSPSIHKVLGRTLYNTTDAASDVDGLAFVSFADGSSKLVAVAGNNFYTSDGEETGTLTLLTNGAGESLEAITVENRAVLLSGGTANAVLLEDGTVRPHGLQPVTTAPGTVHSATGGAWPLGATQLGYFDYWTTEVYKSTDGEDEVESTFAGTPSTENVTAATSYVTITAPGLRNTNATHWRVYRSLKKTGFFDAAFPVGYLIAELPIATPSFTDGITTTTALMAPAVVSSPTATFAIPNIPSSGFAPSVIDLVAWGTPQNTILDDSLEATSGAVKYTTDVQGGQTVLVHYVESWLLISNFSFSGITEPITDINLQIRGRRGTLATLLAHLSWDGGTTWTNAKTIPLTTSNSTVTINGSSWGRTWTASDLSNSSFRLLLRAQGFTIVASSITLDWVKAQVTHGGTTSGQTVLFPSIVITAGPSRVPLGANGPPPVATTGDLLQGSLLMNDPDAPTNVVWTIPGTLDYVPEQYRLALDTDDAVNCIRSLGNIGIVGAESSMHRMNFVPVVEDPEFNTGRCYDTFDRDDGVASRQGMVRFTLGNEPRMFCIGRSNLRITNGFSTESATDDINWADMVEQTAIATCFVKNNTHYSELRVYYPEKGQTVPNKVLHLSYHATHLKNGKLKVAGISNYAANCATTGTHSSGRAMFYTAQSAQIYVENRGYSDDSGTGITPNVSTREIHMAGLGAGWELQRMGIHHQGGGGYVGVSLTTALTNYPTNVADVQQTLMSTRMTSGTALSSAGDGITINLSGTDDGNPWTIDYLLLYAMDHNDSTPLKQ